VHTLPQQSNWPGLLGVVVYAKKLICILSIVSSSAMAFTTEDRMAYQDLNHFKVNCANKQAQIDFLVSQYVGPNGQIANNVYAKTLPGQVITIFDGSYQERQYTASGHRNAVIKQILLDIVRFCP